LVSAQPQDVMTMPSRQTHGDILVIYAVDILVGTECGKNIQLNDVARDECYNRLPHPGELYGPLFNMQNMSYNEAIKENIYNHTSFR